MEDFGEVIFFSLVVSAGAPAGMYDGLRGDSRSLLLSGEDFLSGVT